MGSSFSWPSAIALLAAFLPGPLFLPGGREDFSFVLSQKKVGVN
jgi:hypothetical protein